MILFAIMSPILIGMNNPHHADPRFDLYPMPKNCTGWRIWKMLHDRTGATRTEYVRAFRRRNLIRGKKWDRKKAREAAVQITFYLRPGDTAVLLGDDVRRAMNMILGGRIQKMLIHPQVVDGVVYRCVPHPSGRNLFYNDPAAREIVASLLEDLYGKARKAEEEEHR